MHYNTHSPVLYSHDHSCLFWEWNQTSEISNISLAQKKNGNNQKGHQINDGRAKCGLSKQWSVTLLWGRVSYIIDEPWTDCAKQKKPDGIREEHMSVYRNIQRQMHKEHAGSGCLELKGGENVNDYLIVLRLPLRATRTFWNQTETLGFSPGHWLVSVSSHLPSFPRMQLIPPTSISSAFLSPLSPWICFQS